MSERSSGDGGSDGEAGHYATVGRRMRNEGVYSSLRRPDGGNTSEYDPYASIRETRRGSEGSERVYETISRGGGQENVSSETSSVSQVTVRQMPSAVAAETVNMSDLYARVDMNKKKQGRNSDSSDVSSPLSDYVNDVIVAPAGPPVPAPRKVDATNNAAASCRNGNDG